MGPLGMQETVFIFILALLIFGPRKLPELGRMVGKGMGEFRRASSDLKSTFDREMHAIERESESLKSETSKVTNDIYSSYHDYDSYTESTGYYGSGADKAAGTIDSTTSASAPQGADTSSATAVDTPDSAALGHEPETVAAKDPTAPRIPDMGRTAADEAKLANEKAV